MRARDVMTTSVITVDPETRISEVAGILAEYRISAAPVVRSDGELVGIVSEGDMFRREELGTSGRQSWWLRLFASPDDKAVYFLKTHGLTVADVMTCDVTTVSPEGSLADIAKILERQHIKRVPVVEDGRVVGIVSRADLVRALTTLERHLPTQAAESDAGIRERAIAKLRDVETPRYGGINVLVEHGVAHLWGLVDSDQQKRALLVAARGTPGVREVVSHLGILSGTARQVMWAE